MHFQGIIFDLDGTLINSLEDIANAMNSVLMHFNFPTHPIEAYKLFIGNGLRNLVTVTLPEIHRNEKTIDECLKMLLKIYNSNCIAKTKPYNGIIELLNELKSRNLKIAVFSNKADALTKRIVQELLPDFFKIIIGFTIDELKKPNPALPLQISNEWNILPENILYVGDSGTDMQTSQNAGMYSVGALWGFRTKEELAFNGAQYFLNHPLDLIQLL